MVMQTCLMRISIHTSAREVTAVWVYQVRNGCEFQSTLPQGKWQWQQSWRSTSVPFQSTLPQGKWQIFDFLSQIVKYISIHTSAREVTRYPIQSSLKRTFQSTLPQGKWPLIVSPSPQECDFNPHFRKGSDCEMDTGIGGGKYFNPHFRKGSDLPQLELLHFY